METRALKKVGETRNETFKREVTQIYTVATYVDELGSVDQDHPPTLMCVVEDSGRLDSRIGMTIVCPTTGEVTYDEFQGKRAQQYLGCMINGGVLDNKMRSELEVFPIYISDHLSFLGADRIGLCTQDRTSCSFLRVASLKKRNDY